ncbi:MAG TPA: pectin acetylesterase-family hydrolase [Polyangiaceae bacterium]|nr:pectin acetylesterase-family hydrolase [Polyangiaceae bacterium]
MRKSDRSTAQRTALFPRFGPEIPRTRPGEWQWVDFPDTASASGTPTGLAINFSLDPNAKRALVYFQAGGACWSYATACLQIKNYGAVLHLGGFGREEWETSFVARQHRKMWLFDRRDPSNPFRDAHLVYFPYCTGDIYVGDRVNVLRGPLPGMKKTLHFRGQANVRAYFARLVPTFPELERLYLVGSSAGAYGAAFAWWLANEAWGTVPVDVIADAGHTILLPRERFERLITAWGSKLPDDGPECGHGLRELMEYAACRYMDVDRYALVTTRRDLVLSAFFGMTPETHARHVDELRTQYFDNRTAFAGAANVRYFITDDFGHTVFPTNRVHRARIADMDLKRWLRQMVDEDPAWRSFHTRAA